MLQGTLDNFGLDEVLGLLATTAKTGRMRVTGDRGSGSLWLISGQLVGTEAPNTTDASPMDEALFELLRFNTGSFAFDPHEETPDTGSSQVVSEVVADALERLRQWREIEAVVPSLAHVVAPVALLDVPEITISAEEWELLLAIGSGNEVGGVCDLIGLGEVEGSRRVKLLLERNLLDIFPPADAETDGPDSGGMHTAEPSDHDETTAPSAAAYHPSVEYHGTPEFGDTPTPERRASDALSDDFGAAPVGFTTGAEPTPPPPPPGSFGEAVRRDVSPPPPPPTPTELALARTTLVDDSTDNPWERSTEDMWDSADESTAPEPTPAASSWFREEEGANPLMQFLRDER